MLCTQYLLMFSHLESLVGKLFQVILFMIHSRIIIDWCVTVSWIPGGTTSLGYEPAYTHTTGRIIVFGLITLIYWNRLIIWPIIYNLSLMCPFLSLLSLPLPCPLFFSFSSPHPCPLSLSVSPWNHGQVAEAWATIFATVWRMSTCK